MMFHSFTVVEVCDSLPCRREHPFWPSPSFSRLVRHRRSARPASMRKTSPASRKSCRACAVSFWATWCGPCQEELPRLSQLSHEYVDKPVQFVAASIDDPKDRPKIQPFLAKNNIALNVWIGPDSAILQDFGLGDIVPGTVVIDEHGEIVGRIMGEAQDKDVRSRVDWLLNGRRDPAPEALTKRY